MSGHTFLPEATPAFGTRWAAPLYAGSPGCRAGRKGDGDGLACPVELPLYRVWRCLGRGVLVQRQTGDDRAGQQEYERRLENRAQEREARGRFGSFRPSPDGPQMADCSLAPG